MSSPVDDQSPTKRSKLKRGVGKKGKGKRGERERGRGEREREKMEKEKLYRLYRLLRERGEKFFSFSPPDLIALISTFLPQFVRLSSVYRPSIRSPLSSHISSVRIGLVHPFFFCPCVFVRTFARVRHPFE